MVFRAIVLSLISVAVAYNQGYWQIQVSPLSISTVRYMGAHVSVWEDARKKGRYFATPLVYLNENTANAFMNELTGQAEMRFEVLMWSLEAHEAVLLHIKSDINKNVTDNDVELMHMEQIRMIWRSEERTIRDGYKLDDSWKSNSHLPHVVSFRFLCDNLTACVRLENSMKGRPEFFDGLELEYVMNGQQSSSRQVTVTGENVLQGNLVASLVMLSKAVTQERYVKADDLKTIIAETTRNVMASVETDKEYVDTGDEVSIREILNREFQQYAVLSDKFEPHMWDSVYWKPEWTRPDKITNYLNKVFTKDLNDSKVLKLNEGEHVTRINGSGELNVSGLFKIGGSGGSTSSDNQKIRIDEVERRLREKNLDVQWNGEVFRIKPVSLYRLNLSKLTRSTNIVTANIQVRKFESIRRVKLRVTEMGSQTMMLTPQLLEQRLNAQLNEATQRLTKTVDSVKTGFNLHQNQTENLVTSLGNIGTTYIRWGRTVCPDTNTERVYHGYAGGRHYNQKGGGGDLVCLTRQPEFNNPTSTDEGFSYIYGAEWENPRLFFSDVNSQKKGNNALNYQDVPCAVCRTKRRSSKVMIPGRQSCDGDGWTLEYWGNLMTGYKGYLSSMNHVCVDIAPEPISGGGRAHGGAWLHTVQAKCGSLRCPPYTNNYEITCAVCTK